MSGLLRTAQEAKAVNMQSMGDALGSVYSALWQDVAWLHSNWQGFVIVFGTSEPRVGLLNAAAPRFSRLVQDSIWENVLLHIARLTDPVSTGKKQSLTIRVLPNLIPGRDFAKQAVESKVQAAQ